MTIKDIFLNGLIGKGAHVNIKDAFDDLPWEFTAVQPEGCPFSIWQLLKHMIYWQKYNIAQLENEQVSAPVHASLSWTETIGPSSQSEWLITRSEFFADLDFIIRKVDIGFDEGNIMSQDIKILGSITGHNSYHLGQIVMIRRIVGSWPPPSGGDTW